MSEYKNKALQALDGFAEIVQNEMVVHGSYITQVIDEEKKTSGAICGGHAMCAVGSLYIGGGIEPEWHPAIYGDEKGWWDLPAITGGDRIEELERLGHHGVALAYKTLDGVVYEEFSDQFFFSNGEVNALEVLFENHLAYSSDSYEERDRIDGTHVRASNETRQILLGLIAEAKSRIQAL